MLYWKQGLIRPRKPVSPQHANKTILFGQFVEKRESMQTNNKMAVAPVGKLIWQMSIPPLISMFLQYSYNLIDSAFVARLSENALTAVSLSFPITTLMNATSIWIGVGVNVLIAGYLGQKKQDEANTTVTHGLLLAFGIGALLNLLSLLIMKPYFGAFTNNEEIYQLSLAYILQYSSEIRSAVLLVHGEKAHSRYFSETAYSKLTGDNKELLIIF